MGCFIRTVDTSITLITQEVPKVLGTLCQEPHGENQDLLIGNSTLCWRKLTQFIGTQHNSLPTMNHQKEKKIEIWKIKSNLIKNYVKCKRTKHSILRAEIVILGKNKTELQELCLNYHVRDILKKKLRKLCNTNNKHKKAGVRSLV